MKINEALESFIEFLELVTVTIYTKIEHGGKQRKIRVMQEIPVFSVTTEIGFL